MMVTIVPDSGPGYPVAGGHYRPGLSPGYPVVGGHYSGCGQISVPLGLFNSSNKKKLQDLWAVFLSICHQVIPQSFTWFYFLEFAAVCVHNFSCM
jgi:hypothetical protein